MLNTPHILRTISEEKKVVREIVRKEGITGIISDNRWGARSLLVPSVFITHQVKVLSGITTFLSSKIQQNYIKKFDELWIPDVAEEPSLSGKMGHNHSFKIPIKYLGHLSRFQKENVATKYDITAVLSGPEPQRSMLEEKLLKHLKGIPQKVAIVRGVVEPELKVTEDENLVIYNFLQSRELQDLLNASKIVITRPGYTTLMDLAKLKKQLFVIPTLGQYEQLYLAKRLIKNNLAAGCKQGEFNLIKLEDIAVYKGLGSFEPFN
ncbi:glycosyltransferase [Antarcticibacterium sp. 1MA-6-2]|uniref:glycosyltransferase n=1 Tax=Antarcticibacterium sp. 1MA-6-2 TaxID=2908210 RepID=UPI0028835740|nr:glycosyltransferase [Antarcticibacterium sp. 1MA-6-2]